MTAQALSRSELVARLATILPAMRSRFRAEIPREVQAELRSTVGHITAVQLEALGLIHEHGDGVTMHDLATALGMSASSASQLVERLVRAGLAERRPAAEDRRVVRVVLSDSAVRDFERMHAVRTETLTAVLSPLSDGELATLADLLAKVGRAPEGDR